MNGPVRVRAAREGDCEALSLLYRRSVEQVGSLHYSPEQVRAWAALAPSAEHLRALAGDGRLRLVAVDTADAPVAFADLKSDGHIHFLYCAPEAAHRGVTANLYRVLEAAARAEGIARLHAEASEAASRFFRRQGFTVLARRDFEVAGVAIHNYAVEKRLSETAEV